VKNNVVPGPALPSLPNRSAHSPSISSVLPFGFSMLPRKRPSHGIKGGDVAAAELSNQDRVAELPEVVCRPDHAPGRVHRVSVFQALNQVTVRVKDVHKPQAGASHRIVPGGVLLGISDVEIRTDPLDVEWGKAIRNPDIPLVPLIPVGGEFQYRPEFRDF
jgi:hypothetical protein